MPSSSQIRARVTIFRVCGVLLGRNRTHRTRERAPALRESSPEGGFTTTKVAVVPVRPAGSAGSGVVGDGRGWVGCLGGGWGLLWRGGGVGGGGGGGWGWGRLGVVLGRGGGGGGVGGGGEFVLVPGIGRPPLVVPAARRAG